MKRSHELRTFFRSWAILLPVLSAVRAADKPPTVDDPAIAEQLAVIARVGPLGTGSSEVRIARDALARRGPEILPGLLVAMDTRNVVAANWYRTVFEEIVKRESAQESIKQTRVFLLEYAGESRHTGRPRRLALALVERFEPGFTATWIATRLGDPEFGYEAVAHALVTGEQALRDKETALAKKGYRIRS